MASGRLFLVPVINAMGPVSDAAHDDLLTTWDEVVASNLCYFNDSFRDRFRDSAGRPAVISWFFISWSGFTTNPVHRDFGWFTVFDHYRSLFGAGMERFGDRLHWMYNHPPASGIGNEWGLDWLQNTHYLEVLNRFLIDRGYFPSVVEVPTEGNETSHWLEQWFPFDFGNRNCRDLNLDAIEADGKTTGSVLDWSLAPDDWSSYHPNPDDHRVAGRMNRTIFRLLDIKTRIYQLRPEEIEKAFRRCRQGHDTVLAAYEHDFRDRSGVVSDLLLEPVSRIAHGYPDVEWRYADALDAAQSVSGATRQAPPRLSVKLDSAGVRIHSSREIFGPTPYVSSREMDAAIYRHHPAARIGRSTWEIRRDALPDRCLLAVAASDPGGNVGTGHYLVEGDTIQERTSPALASSAGVGGSEFPARLP